jgi:hypothetical protein
LYIDARSLFREIPKYLPVIRSLRSPTSCAAKCFAVGAKGAHQLPTETVRKIVAVLLVVIGVAMLANAFR